MVEPTALGYPAAQERAFRKAVDMRVFTDPGANRVALFYGQLSGCPFAPERQFGGFKTGELGLRHVVLMTQNIDAMMAFYGVLALRQGRKVTMSLGKHTNDEVVSFYTMTPSGFELEYGCGGRTIDDEDDWRVVEYDDISFWGHLGPLRAPV